MSESISVRLPKELIDRIDNLAKQTGRTKTYYIQEALLEKVSDLELVYLAQKREEDLRAGRSSPAGSGSSRSDASVRSCPASEDDMARRACASCLCRRDIRRGRQRCRMVRCRTTGAGGERRWRFQARKHRAPD
mgnify:CR=1 FL=1